MVNRARGEVSVKSDVVIRSAWGRVFERMLCVDAGAG